MVGAGFAGSVCARRLADAGHRVHVVERRSHIGGNAFDALDAHGVLVHVYGPHVFHTNSHRVLAFLSRFTDWRFYEHRVLAEVDGQRLPIPINRSTLNRLYGLQLASEDEVQAHYDRVRLSRPNLLSSEDVVLASVGADLCDKFFRGYTRKQWGLELSELSAGVAARIPTRTNDDDRYFSDTWQLMPSEGYTAMFQRLLEHPNIVLDLNTDFDPAAPRDPAEHLVYTGPIDAYFGRCFGPLPYRSLRFEHEHLADTVWHQSVGTVNYPQTEAYTRVTEFKHLTGQDHPGTSIVREYGQADGEPYYPIPRPENEALLRRYQALAEATPGVSFVGRLAQYRYYNMDQVVAAALMTADTLLAAPGHGSACETALSATVPAR